jgi:hypothetical protein
MLSQKAWIFENRSGAYIEVCEQRIAENSGFMASIVRDFEQALRPQAGTWFLRRAILGKPFPLNVQREWLAIYTG